MAGIEYLLLTRLFIFLKNRIKILDNNPGDSEVSDILAIFRKTIKIVTIDFVKLNGH